MPVYWQIKSIEVTKVDDPNKFDKMIFAIRDNKSYPGFSTVLWSVSHKVSSVVVHFCVSGPSKAAMEDKNEHKMGSKPPD